MELRTWIVTDSRGYREHVEAEYYGITADGTVNFFRKDEPGMHLAATFYHPVAVILVKKES